MMSFHKFVFIAGLHRSGTTFLARLLRNHDEISGFENTDVPKDEGQHLQNVYPPAKLLGGPGLFGFHKNAYLNESSELITTQNKEALFRQWSKYWDLTKPFLLEKSPPNILKTRFLQEVFPNSFFIFITRHPIAVSMATNAFTGRSIELDKQIDHWLICHEKFQDDLPYLRNVIMFKYEDFVENTQKYLDKISDFLKCRPIILSIKVKPNSNQKYIEKWNQLPQSERDMLINKYEKRISKFGYSFKEFNNQST
jgi:Sulfotransferase family